eukprot:TRINITY_DN24297_c0_g1_i1.p1 TRINITY_DN24297_c0_g1~~TRINITY_DN24297_c0_g1_i1.p1  ORF type:complete len:207 (+),score=30.75 TRINITY_DN24297_c0_g1_i1:97-717(+)
MAPKSADRAENMRERLAAKAAGKSGQSGQPLQGFLPHPQTAVAGKTLSWICWAAAAALTAAALTGSLVGDGSSLAWICFVGNFVLAAYFLSFGAAGLLAQQRYFCTVLSLFAALVSGLRVVVYLSLLVLIVAYLITGYNLLERLLYCVPGNHPDCEDDLSLDFVQRVLTAAPQPLNKQFTLQRQGGAEGGSGGFEYGTTRAERRKR